MGIIDDVLVGAASVGEGEDLARVELILGPRGSSVETAFCQAFVNGNHFSSLAVVSPDLSSRPYTVVFNKMPFTDSNRGVELFELVQAAVAAAVVDCVEDGIIPVEEVDEFFLCVGVFVREKTANERNMQDNYHKAVKSAVKRAISREPKVSDVLIRREAIRPSLRVYSG